MSLVYPRLGRAIQRPKGWTELGAKRELAKLTSGTPGALSLWNIYILKPGARLCRPQLSLGPFSEYLSARTMPFSRLYDRRLDDS